jgi:hypothetical protein
MRDCTLNLLLADLASLPLGTRLRLWRKGVNTRVLAIEIALMLYLQARAEFVQHPDPETAWIMARDVVHLLAASQAAPAALAEGLTAAANIAADLALATSNDPDLMADLEDWLDHQSRPSKGFGRQLPNRQEVLRLFHGKRKNRGQKASRCAQLTDAKKVV